MTGNNSLRVNSGLIKFGGICIDLKSMFLKGQGSKKRNSHVSLVSAGKEDSAMQNSNMKVFCSLILFVYLDEENNTGMGICGGILLWVSWSLFLVTLPFSLLVCFKVCKIVKIPLLSLTACFILVPITSKTQ